MACIGIKDSLTGDTLCDPDHPIILDKPTFPEPVISMSIEPKTAGDKQKLGEALTTLRREDPTFFANYDDETGQTIISGMGELHLEILRNKLTRDMKVEVNVGKPKVAYKETITRKAEARGVHKKQTGGRGQFGDCTVSVEPYTAEQAVEDELKFEDTFAFENKIFGGTIPKEYIPSVEYGARMAAKTGVLANFPPDQLQGDAARRQHPRGRQQPGRLRAGRSDRVQGRLPEGRADAAGADHEGRRDDAGGVSSATSTAT